MRHPINHYYRVKEAVESIKDLTSTIMPFPSIAIILGSGLGVFADELARDPRAMTIPYARIENFPEPSVSGHNGKLVMTPNVAVLSGRVHSYEGYDAETIALPIRALVKCGARIVILTNAVGALSTRDEYHPGSLVLIKSHVNLLPELNPLRGGFDPEFLREEFIDLGDLYNLELRRRTHEISQRLFDRNLPEGILAIISGGRSYETPAEINFLRRQGIDLVGISVVAEALAAHAMPERPRILGISCVTNFAAGLSPIALSHADITTAAAEARPEFLRLLKTLVGELTQNHPQ